MNRAITQPMRAGKIVRWIAHLSDGQVVELAWRLCRGLADPTDISPERLRAILTTFAEEMPKC